MITSMDSPCPSTNTKKPSRRYGTKPRYPQQSLYRLATLTRRTLQKKTHNTSPREVPSNGSLKIKARHTMAATLYPPSPTRQGLMTVVQFRNCILASLEERELPRILRLPRSQRRLLLRTLGRCPRPLHRSSPLPPQTRHPFLQRPWILPRRPPPNLSLSFPQLFVSRADRG